MTNRRQCIDPKLLSGLSKLFRRDSRTIVVEKGGYVLTRVVILGTFRS